MAFNLNGAAQVPLSVFGGLCSEMAPPDLPEGVSPACAEVVFAPGSVDSRPAFRKVFAASPFPAPVVYAKSFVSPTGALENLYLDSQGTLWHEGDPINHPGNATRIGGVAPGSKGKSITAFGREYIAPSDGLHGTDVPLQWDGTYLDRVTQDGPGAPPAVASIALPSVAMVAGSSVPLAIVTCNPAGGAFNVVCSTSTAALSIGDQFTISGSPVGFYNATWTVATVYPGSNMVIVMAYVPPGTVAASGGTLTPLAGATIMRRQNIVTVFTAAAHQLQVGYQAQITGVPASAIGTAISSIVINNADLPGVALVTTSAAHGLVPGASVNIKGIKGATVAAAAGVTSMFRVSGVVTVVTVTAHGLLPGAVITIAGVSGTGGAGFNTTATVLTVNSLTEFTFYQSSTTDITTSPTVTGATIGLNWPISQGPEPIQFEVLSAPTATTFQVQLNYADGTWSGAAVSGAAISYAWDGTFFVTAIPSATIFQFKQYGPDSYSTVVGAVTPHGQAAPGRHQCQLHFLTRQGYLTKGSPPVEFVANGGQLISVSNILSGPPNVVARVLSFTGAQGAYFFYIPTPAQINGQQVSTATQINDNSTTSIILDFSDPTLFASVAVSIPGNDVANQMVLDGALGFGLYAGRLVTWGQRNRIQNLLNMGFDGGYLSLPFLPVLPSGWTALSADDGVSSALASDHFGLVWNIHVTSLSAGAYGVLRQPMYQDAYGVPIAKPNTKYKLRVWLKGGGYSFLTFTATMAGTGFSTTATILGTSMTAAGSFVEAAFGAATPSVIPSDLTLTIQANSSTGATFTLSVDDISILYADNPYSDALMFGSYVENPEAFDGVSGKLGSAQDTHKVMDVGGIRDTLYFLTQEPGGRLHQTQDNGVTEPAGWTVRQTAANCGLLSAWSLTKSQADDSTASGGEEWLAWATSSGARIFGGGRPDKISQEIQPDWIGAGPAGASAWSTELGINPAAQLTVWALNDPAARRMYFGLPIGTAIAPSRIYVLDYRELDSAEQISSSAPIHASYTGKLIATDHTRKWCPWLRSMNGAALMYRSAGLLSPVFFGGNAAIPTPGGNAYTLDPAKLTDDDFGQIHPAYTTYFFVTHDQEQTLTCEVFGVDPLTGKRKMTRQELGGGVKLLAYLTAMISGVGQITITPLCNSLTNPWSIVGVRPMSISPTFDLEWAGGNTQAQRMALQFASSPITGTDNSFSLQRVLAALRPGRFSLRGSSV